MTTINNIYIFFFFTLQGREGRGGEGGEGCAVNSAGDAVLGKSDGAGRCIFFLAPLELSWYLLWYLSGQDII